MAFTHTLQQSVQAGSQVVTGSKQFSGSAKVSLEETVANGLTDSLINVAIDVSAVKCFILLSDQNVTIETNNGTTPDNTIALIANVAYVWCSDSYDTFKLTVDVTKFYVTNSSGATATIKLEALVDATP
jgi:hypothetical protein